MSESRAQVVKEQKEKLDEAAKVIQTMEAELHAARLALSITPGAVRRRPGSVLYRARYKL